MQMKYHIQQNNKTLHDIHSTYLIFNLFLLSHYLRFRQLNKKTSRLQIQKQTALLIQLPSRILFMLFLINTIYCL